MGSHSYHRTHFRLFTHAISEEGENSTICGLDRTVYPDLIIGTEINYLMCTACKKYLALHSGGDLKDPEAIEFYKEAMKEIDAVSERTKARQQDFGMMTLLPPYEREWWLLENLEDPQGIDPDVLEEAEVQEARERIDVDEWTHHVYMQPWKFDLFDMNPYEATLIRTRGVPNQSVPLSLKNYKAKDFELLYVKKDETHPFEKILTLNGHQIREVEIHKIIIRGDTCFLDITWRAVGTRSEMKLPTSSVFTNVPRWEWQEAEKIAWSRYDRLSL